MSGNSFVIIIMIIIIITGLLGKEIGRLVDE
jgi:hypothetical protein